MVNVHILAVSVTINEHKLAAKVILPLQSTICPPALLKVYVARGAFVTNECVIDVDVLCSS